jgi:hypothetical protein
VSAAATSEALGLAWLRTLHGWPRELWLDPAGLAALAARCPTVAILRAALSDLEAMGSSAWQAMAFAAVPRDQRGVLAEYLELHEWLVLHGLIDDEGGLPDGPEATALLRGAFDPDRGLLRFGGRGRGTSPT